MTEHSAFLHRWTLVVAVMLLASCTSAVQSGPEESQAPHFPTPPLGTRLVASDADVVFLGAQKDAYAGWSVELAGDLNEDGHDDVVIGAPYWDAQVVTISEGPFEPVELLSESVRLGKPADVHREMFFGVQASDAGDINGDGHRDLAVVASPLFTDVGGGTMTFVYFGPHPSEPALTLSKNGDWFLPLEVGRDLDLDGFADILVGDPTDWDPEIGPVGRVLSMSGPFLGPELS